MLIISITSHCLIKRLEKIKKRKCINIDSCKMKYLFALTL